MFSINGFNDTLEQMFSINGLNDTLEQMFSINGFNDTLEQMFSINGFNDTLEHMFSINGFNDTLEQMFSINGFNDTLEQMFSINGFNDTLEQMFSIMCPRQSAGTRLNWNVLETKDAAAKHFIAKLFDKYPGVLHNVDVEITVIYEAIMRSCIIWSSNLRYNHTDSPDSQFSLNNESLEQQCPLRLDVMYGCNNTSDLGDNLTLLSSPDTSEHGHSLEEHIAHAFHMASITILSILVFEQSWNAKKWFIMYQETDDIQT
ncbi:hypothetical protein Btru_061617 [Bulinus truncatus]|nr:hypothetical protein Btru_061617 [Bulinus truncatus]